METQIQSFSLREILGGNDNVVLKYRHSLSQVALFQAVLA